MSCVPAHPDAEREAQESGGDVRNYRACCWACAVYVVVILGGEVVDILDLQNNCPANKGQG